MPSCGWPSLAAELFPSATRRSMCLTLIVGERPMAALQSRRDVSAARPSRPELPCAASVPARLQKAPATNVDLRLKAACNRTYERADRALDHAGLRPARRRQWRICRRRFKGLTGDDRTRCAGCGRRRKAVVAEPRRTFVGLMHPAGMERGSAPSAHPGRNSHSCRGRSAPGRRSRRRIVSGSGRASRAAIPLRPA